MKKIIGLLVLFATLLSLVFSFTACGNDGYKEYREMGLYFKLPSEFRKFYLYDWDIHYSTIEAKFQVQIVTNEEDEYDSYAPVVDMSKTVKEFTEEYIEDKKWECEYKYDEARDVATFYFFWAPPAESEDLAQYEYYFVTVLKSESAFYLVFMSCEESLYTKYEEKFRAWSSYLEIT